MVCGLTELRKGGSRLRGLSCSQMEMTFFYLSLISSKLNENLKTLMCSPFAVKFLNTTWWTGVWFLNGQKFKQPFYRWQWFGYIIVLMLSAILCLFLNHKVAANLKQRKSISLVWVPDKPCGFNLQFGAISDRYKNKNL